MCGWPVEGRHGADTHLHTSSWLSDFFSVTHAFNYFRKQSHVFNKAEGILVVIVFISTWLEMETVLQCGSQYSALALLEKWSKYPSWTRTETLHSSNAFLNPSCAARRLQRLFLVCFPNWWTGDCQQLTFCLCAGTGEEKELCQLTVMLSVLT